ncbi:MAG: MFS transporter [Candidatus Saccharibacteria bacterium]
MISVMASMFLVALDQMVVSTSLGKIVEEFNAFSMLGWVVTAYMITTTITVPIAGKLSDLFGRRLMLLIGVGVFVAGSLMGGMSGDINQLILWRAIQGIGGGIITANAFSIVGDLFAARERGKWQGLIGAVFGLSSIAGPLIGGFLTEPHNFLGLITNWRWTLLINVPIGIIAFIIIRIYCPTLKHDRKPRVDYVGAALIAVGLATLILAIDNTEAIFANLMNSTGLTLVWLRVIMFTIVGLALAAFVAVEKRAAEPIVPIYFFKNRNFVKIIVIAMLFGSAFLGSILYLTQFNQQVFGASPTTSGLMLLPMVGGMTLTSVGVGQLISKTGKYKIFMKIGFSIATIAVLALTTLDPNTSYVYEAIIITFIGVGMGVAMPVISLAVQNEFEQKDLGAATSSSQLFRSIGSTVGVAIFGAILTAGVASGLGNMSDSKYIQTLKQSPAASIMGDLTKPDTLLRLNTPSVKQNIADQSNAVADKLPTAIGVEMKKQIVSQQTEFANVVVRAYSDSMHRIFIIATVLMASATAIVFTLKERVLRSAKPIETPGEM